MDELRVNGERYVTFRWLLGAVIGMIMGGAAVTASAFVYLDTKLSDKVNVDMFVSEKMQNDETRDDIKWIRECMVTKCWERP